MESDAVVRRNNMLASTGESVFDRLYKTHTISSKLKRRGVSTIKNKTLGKYENVRQANYNKPLHSTLGQKFDATIGSIHFSRTLKYESRQHSVVPKATAPTLAPPLPEDNDASAWNIAIHTSLRLCKKYDDSYTFTDLSPSNLKLVPWLAKYEAEELTKQQVAASIINAIFTRDFPHDTGGGGGVGGSMRRWEVAASTARELDDCLYAVEKHATWDWGDYSVSQATATIRFEGDTISVEEYSFFRCWLKSNGGTELKRMYYGYKKDSKGYESPQAKTKVDVKVAPATTSSSVGRERPSPARKIPPPATKQKVPLPLPEEWAPSAEELLDDILS